jgi:hypothetical protein
LLWVTREGIVRYANGEAAARTGLAPGRKLYDPDLSRAVVQSIAGRAPRNMTAAGVLGGAESGELKCRVIPGLAQDDAFVLIGQQIGQDDGSGFDNLMEAIRTDVREPLRSAHAALQVAQAQGGGGAELEALGNGVGQVLEVVDKLVDLASLWGSGTLLANDRIELWPLLQQAWAEVEPLALDRSVKVRFHALADADSLAALYGSERWLRRVFAECLDAAVRATQRGSLLEIEHRQMGPRALLVFRDCGVFAARNSAAPGVPMPTRGKGAAEKAPAIGAREQIGLKLCQHIVSLHGGNLREEHDDGQRNFLIELPTGAPHRETGPQLDIVQAQRYASDLAALMTRARQREAAAKPAPAGR